MGLRYLTNMQMEILAVKFFNSRLVDNLTSDFVTLVGVGDDDSLGIRHQPSPRTHPINIYTYYRVVRKRYPS